MASPQSIDDQIQITARSLVKASMKLGPQQPVTEKDRCVEEALVDLFTGAIKLLIAQQTHGITLTELSLLLNSRSSDIFEQVFERFRSEGNPEAQSSGAGAAGDHSREEGSQGGSPRGGNTSDAGVIHSSSSSSVYPASSVATFAISPSEGGDGEVWQAVESNEEEEGEGSESEDESPDVSLNGDLYDSSIIWWRR